MFARRKRPVEYELKPLGSQQVERPPPSSPYRIRWLRGILGSLSTPQRAGGRSQHRSTINRTREGDELPNMLILTPRLQLRPAQRADRDELHRLEQDPEVMRYLNGGVPTPLEPVDPDAVSFLMPRGGEPEVWAVVERESGSLAGWVALFVDDGTGELGYRFFRAFWGRGYATEAARAVISDAFERVGVVRIKALTMAVNTRSRRVMERLAMRHTETRIVDWSDPLPGIEEGEVEYVLERDSWRP